MTESPLMDSGFAILIFSPGDDPIACLNKAMTFLIVVASSRFPSTNHQLRTSSNVRNQATIQDDRVLVQKFQGRQGQSYSGTGYKGNATSYGGNNASGQARDVKCYNHQDPGVPDGQAVQTIIPNNASFQTEDLDTYDSDCDDISNAKAVLMANISNYGSDIILEIITITVTSNSFVLLYLLEKTENEDLKAQIQDKVFVITSLKNDLRKVKGKEIVDIAAQIPSANTIVPGMFKLDLEPLAPRLLQNREAHIDYLKYTQKKVDLLSGIVEQAKAEQPLDKELGPFPIAAQRIQELLVYVRDTCPNAINLSAKKVAVTPKNKVKKVRFAEPLTSSSNIKQVESSNTSDSNTPVLSSTGLKCSTSKCGSKPTGNKRNDRISQTPSRNMKNKVEAQPRKVNKKNRVVEPIRDVNVKHSLLNANSEPICATCKKSMFDGVHDMCLLDFVENVNSHAKSAKKHKKQNIWKPTGHVFTKVGLKWKPTGRTFTIVGNSCPLTRITSANIVPPKKTTSHSVETQKPELKVYSRKPKNVKNIFHRLLLLSDRVSRYDFWLLGLWMFETHDREPLLVMNFVSKFLDTVRFGNDNIARIMGYGDYHLGNVTNSSNLEGVDLLFESRDINLYMISLDDMLKTSLICLLSKASKTKSWLWHLRLSHLNFSTLNKLAKYGLARDISRLKFQKDHLCSACALGKNKKSSHQPKAEYINQEKLYLLYMDLCGLMRVAIINGKRTKDKAPEAIIKCIKNIQVRLNATCCNVRTDNEMNLSIRHFVNFMKMLASRIKTLLAAILSRTASVEGETKLFVEAASTK
ncbi:retrovirus-related pol polyprotein from transposon TNT 1-94 [Tanacetum coccineum]